MIVKIRRVETKREKRILEDRKIPYFYPATLAQLVEHLTLNQQVAGSNPAGCTKRLDFTLNRAFFILKNFGFSEKRPIFNQFLPIYYFQNYFRIKKKEHLLSALYFL